jgi:hypothetical protein
MKFGTRIIRFILLFIGVPGCLWYTYKIAQPWFQVDRFDVRLACNFSPNEQKAVNSFFQTNALLKHVPLDHICAYVRKQFPSIGQLSLVQDASGVVMATADPTALCCCVNDDLVVDYHGNLLKQAAFAEQYTRLLPVVVIPHLASCCVGAVTNGQVEYVGMLLPELVTTLKSMPSSLFEHFFVSCNRCDAWLLVEKQQPRFAILFHGSQIPQEKMIAMCTKLKGTLEVRGAFANPTDPGWIADVRFENQIVLFRNAGGVHE